MLAAFIKELLKLNNAVNTCLIDTFLDSLALLTFVGTKVWLCCLYLQLLATGSCEYTRKLLGA